MVEKWIRVKGRENEYKVSSYGRIKSIPRFYMRGKFKISIRGRIMKLIKGGHGYYYISLAKNGISDNILVHRIVAENFIDNPLNKREVNHIDGDKLNNHVSNLEWTTPKENSQHSVRIGLSLIGENSPSAKLTEAQVKDIRRRLREGEMMQKDIAALHGIHPVTIIDIKKGKSWKHLK